MNLPKIEYALRRIRAAGENVTLHMHDTWELVMYISGEGRCICNDLSYEYSAGSICLIPPNTHHKEINRTETDLIFCSFVPSGAGCREGMFDGDAELSAAAIQMVKAMTERSAGAEQIAAMYLSIILLRLGLRDSAEGEQVEEKNRSLDSAFRYIFDYYNTDIKPRELAASVGYSYDRFRHIFKEKYGVTPKQMILYKRLDAAKQQLRRDGKIENIARSCGFGSATQFNVIFKKTQGMTPGEYRAREKQAQ